MPRLPVAGQDLGDWGNLLGDWGNLLNEFLLVSHRADGTLKASIKVVNVKDFGAKGTGDHDDYYAIQNSIDYVSAAGGGTVIFPYGIYSSKSVILLTTGVKLDLTSGAIIRRDFGDSGISLEEPHSRGLMGVRGDARDIQILGGTLDGNGRNSGALPFNIFGGVGFRGLKIDGTTFLDVYGFHALDLADSQDVTIRNCRFIGFKRANDDHKEAIQLDPNILDGQSGASNMRITIENCYFGPNPDCPEFGAPDVGIGNHAAAEGHYSKQLRIVGCVFDQMSFAGIRGVNFSDSIIEGNTFINLHHGVQIDLYYSSAREFQDREGCEEIIISNNHFSQLTGNALYMNAPPKADSVVKNKRISFIENTIKDISGAVIDAKWCSGLTISNNTAVTAKGFVHMRFCDTVLISGNNVRYMNDNAVWIYEKYETQHAGKGHTADIKIEGNLFYKCGYRGVHVNCFANRITINGNTIIDSDERDGDRAALKIDHSANYVVMIGNVIQFSDESKSSEKNGLKYSERTDIVDLNNVVQK